MAFGGFKGSLVGGNNSIPNPLPATGSVTVAIGDLIVAVIAQQTALTVTAVTDNLTNTYTAQNAGTLSTISGRMFYSRATFAGTLSTVNFATTASANDASCAVAVYEGPFLAPPIDVNLANLSADLTTPYSCPASGTLAQAQELIIGWFAAASTATYTAGGGFTKNVQQSQSANASTSIASLAVSATTTQTPSWTGTAPTADVLGTASFKRDPINTTTAGAAGTSTLTAATGTGIAGIAVSAPSTSAATATGTAINGAPGVAAGGSNQTVYRQATTGGGSNQQSKTSVVVLAAGNFSAAYGRTVRLSVQMQAASAGSTVVFYIGQQAASGDVYDFQGTPTRVTFGGADYITTTSTATVVSDWVDLPQLFDAGKNYCVAINWPAIFISPFESPSIGDSSYAKSAAGDAATVDKSGYSLAHADYTHAVNRIEVRADWVGAVAATPTYVIVSWAQAVATDAVGGATSATASAAGTGAAQATGAYVANRNVTAAGTSTAQASGAFVAQRTVTAAGTSTAQATGAYTDFRTVTAAGTGTATSTGTAVWPVAVTAAGAGAATATGLSFFAATATAAGTGTAVGTGGQVGVNAGNAAGLGGAAATGSSSAASNAIAAATGTATATGQRIVFSAAVAAATATGTAQATGRAFVAGVANAAGSGTTTATSRVTVAGVGNAAGIGSAQAGGQWIIAAVAAATGIGQAQAVGLVSTGNIKTQYLTAKRTPTLSVTGSDQAYAVTGQRTRPSITGTKLPPAIIAQRKAPATWIAQQ